MVSTPSLKAYLEEKKIEKMFPFIKSLKDVELKEKVMSIISSNTPLFPTKLPKCQLGDEELQGEYSLTTCFPDLAMEGTLWYKQLAKLSKAKLKGEDTTISCHGRIRAVSDGTFQVGLLGGQTTLHWCNPLTCLDASLVVTGDAAMPG